MPTRSPLLQLLRRRAGFVALTTVVALGIAVMALSLLPVSYAATSTVRVATIVPPGSGGASYDLYYSDRLVNTYSRVLTSRPVIEQMRERVGRDTNQQLPAHPKIAIELPPNTELVTLTVRASTPELAAAAANALGAAFIDDLRTWASQQAPAPAVRAEVVEEAQPSAAARVPSWILTLGVAGVLGVAAGFAVVLALQRIRPALLTPDAVADATGLPVLGYLDGGTPDRQDALLFRIALQLGRTESPLVLVAGADGADTVTRVVVGLGRAAAQANREVLLIDTDFDQPRLHAALGLPNDVGIGSIATGEVVASELVRKSHVPGVSLLAAGPRPPAPVEFLASSPCRSVINDLARLCDLALLAAPGVLHGMTASILALQAGEAVLVVREGAGRAETQEAAAHLSALPLRVAGVVVCRPARRRWKGEGA